MYYNAYGIVEEEKMNKETKKYILEQMNLTEIEKKYIKKDLNDSRQEKIDKIFKKKLKEINKKIAHTGKELFYEKGKQVIVFKDGRRIIIPPNGKPYWG